MEKNIQEFFAVPSGELYVAANFAGMELYSSKNLVEKYSKVMGKNKVTKPVIDTINVLLEDKEIIPCYVNKSILKTIFKQTPPAFKGIMGMSLDKYIYIFVNNNSNIFSFTTSNKLALTTIHELVHKSAKEKSKKFIQLFLDDLTKFYKNYWNRVFKLKINKIKDNDIQILVKYMFDELEGKGRSLAKFIQYKKLLTKICYDNSYLKYEVLERTIDSYITFIENVLLLLYKNNTPLLDKYIFNNAQYIKPFYKSYRDVFKIEIREIKELCFQELYVPSEVICITTIAKNPNPKIYQLIKK